MAQYLRPDGDITTTNVSAGTYASIDESTYSDADYVIGTNNTTTTYECSLGNPGATPASGTCTVRFRHAQGDHDTASYAPASQGTAWTTVTCAVVEGTTVLATDSAQTNSEAWVARSFTFATSLVTDWTDLRLRFTITGAGGATANRRTGAVSWAEIETPDAAVAIDGSLAVSLADVLASAAGGVLVAGAAANTLGSVGISASAHVSEVVASLAVTLGPSAGWQVHNVTDISQAGDTDCIYYGASPPVASGDQLLVATTSGTYGRTITVDSQGLVSASAGGADTVAWYHWTDSNDTWSASKSYSLAATLSEGALAVSLADVLAAATGEVLVSGTASITVDSVGLSASAETTITGAGAATLDGITSSGAGAVAVTGTFSVSLADVALSSAGEGPETALASIAVTLDAPSGWQVHNVSDISQAGDTGCIYYGHSPAVAVSDQLLIATATTTNAWPITIDAQGFVEIDSGGSGGADSFGYYVFDETDDTWGTLGTFSLTAVAIAEPVIGGGGSSHKAYSSRRLRKDVDDWLERERLRELAEQIRREDEELVVILTAIAA